MTETNDTHDQLQRQPTRWYTCTAFQRDLLLAIVAHDRLNKCPYGLSLHEWVDARYPQTIGPSRVYTNLDDLEEAGLITCEAIDERTNAYRLTDVARTTLATHGQFIDALALPALNPSNTE